MQDNAKGLLIIGSDATLMGDVRNCARMEVRGVVTGNVAAQSVVVVEGGRLLGTLRAGTAEVNGEFEGTAHVRDVLRIGSAGTVSGDVNYHQLAMVAGATLSATMRNVPPKVFGDLEVTVQRGRTVRIETADLNAVDPDDAAQSLTFSVTGATGGHVGKADAPDQAVTSFTQAELAAGQVCFAHNGASGSTASFKVIVTDAAGATSGAPKTVHVSVVDAR